MKFEPSMLSAYLDGELTAEEMDVVEYRLRHSEEDRHTLLAIAELKRRLATLPQEAFRTDPVVGVRQRIDRSLAGSGDRLTADAPRHSAPWQWFIPLALAATLLMIAVVAMRTDGPAVAIGDATENPAATSDRAAGMATDSPAEERSSAGERALAEMAVPQLATSEPAPSAEAIRGEPRAEQSATRNRLADDAPMDAAGSAEPAVPQLYSRSDRTQVAPAPGPRDRSAATESAPLPPRPLAPDTVAPPEAARAMKAPGDPLGRGDAASAADPSAESIQAEERLGLRSGTTAEQGGEFQPTEGMRTYYFHWYDGRSSLERLPPTADSITADDAVAFDVARGTTDDTLQWIVDRLRVAPVTRDPGEQDALAEANADVSPEVGNQADEGASANLPIALHVEASRDELASLLDALRRFLDDSGDRALLDRDVPESLQRTDTDAAPIADAVPPAESSASDGLPQRANRPEEIGLWIILNPASSEEASADRP